jgi:flavin-dependent dehydrogenase
LQKSLGFNAPDSHMGIYIISNTDDSLLNDNFNFQYMFHLNPNISKTGPFFFNVGKGRIFAGFMGDKESPLELKSKLERILNNYQKIQPYIKTIRWNFDNVVVGDISKHPIKNMTADRVMVLGEAAGLVTAFFYEGMLCGLVSADTASNTIAPLIKDGSNFSSEDLKKYDKEITELLLNGYFRNGNACEYLFYGNQSSLKSIWNAYTEMLVNDKTARRYVYEVIMLQDLKKYNTDNDRWVGEKLFATLPLLSKATLWPKFLKAMNF